MHTGIKITEYLIKVHNTFSSTYACMHVARIDTCMLYGTIQ